MKPERQKRQLAESHIERQISDFLALDGWVVRHLEQNFNPRKIKLVGERGMPDLLAIRYNQKPHYGCKHSANVLWIEVKREGGLLSPAQRAWRELESARGATVLAAGYDFVASLDGFAEFYEKSGLQIRYVGLQNRRDAAGARKP